MMSMNSNFSFIEQCLKSQVMDIVNMILVINKEVVSNTIKMMKENMLKMCSTLIEKSVVAWIYTKARHRTL